MGTWPFVQRGPSLGSRAQSFKPGASLALLLAVPHRSPCLCPQVLKNKPTVYSRPCGSFLCPG